MVFQKHCYRKISLLLTFSAGAVYGQLPSTEPTSQAVGIDLSTPQAAVKTMLAAEHGSDSQALRACLYAATDPQRDLVAAYADLILAGRHLQDAARTHFSTETVPPSNVPPNPAAVQDGLLAKGPGLEMPEQVDSAQVESNGDTATVQLPDRPTPIQLHNTAGQWQVDLTDFTTTSPDQLAEQTQVNHDLADALNQAAEEITAGKYASAQEAESAVQQKIHAVIAPQLKKLATTAPTTQASN
jgi:hypothetical protein